MSDKQDKAADVDQKSANPVVNEEIPADVEAEVALDETAVDDGEIIDPILVDSIVEDDPLAGLGMITQLAEAQAEIADLKDKMLRTVAEAQNTKRRAEQDVIKAHKFGTEKFANEMLPILDSLGMALLGNADDEASKAIHEGVTMTLQMFLSSLEKFNVVQVDPQGEAFDPGLHQAMSMVDGGEAPSNSVIAVMQKGFTMNGRLLRPAMVMVAK